MRFQWQPVAALPANLTMSSVSAQRERLCSAQRERLRKIAELVDSRHDNVKRTIDALIKQRVIVHPQTEDVPFVDAMGRQRNTEAYVFTGEQGKPSHPLPPA